MRYRTRDLRDAILGVSAACAPATDPVNPRTNWPWLDLSGSTVVADGGDARLEQRVEPDDSDGPGESFRAWSKKNQPATVTWPRPLAIPRKVLTGLLGSIPQRRVEIVSAGDQDGRPVRDLLVRAGKVEVRLQGVPVSDARTESLTLKRFDLTGPDFANAVRCTLPAAVGDERFKAIRFLPGVVAALNGALMVQCRVAILDDLPGGLDAAITAHAASVLVGWFDQDPDEGAAVTVTRTGMRFARPGSSCEVRFAHGVYALTLDTLSRFDKGETAAVLEYDEVASMLANAAAIEARAVTLQVEEQALCLRAESRAGDSVEVRTAVEVRRATKPVAFDARLIGRAFDAVRGERVQLDLDEDMLKIRIPGETSPRVVLASMRA